MRRTMLYISMAMIACVMLFSAKANAQRTPDIQAFKKLKVSGAYTLSLKQGNEYSLRMEGPDDKLDKVEISNQGNTLEIGTKRNTSERWTNFDDVKIFITYRDLSEINISGACNITTDGQMKVDDLKLDISGAGELTIDLKANSLDTDISGAASVELRGSVDTHDIELSGAGTYSAYELESKDVDVTSSGAGTVKVHASNRLNANASGVGSIYYKGDPSDTHLNTSGMGKIKNKN
ncbi:head GIN domain-containing protein [Roseivirga sp. BDSF3-8]|uniref:head GIN domain-containing protein n=1 Tax=Roseivirga sp. BDSF3-8 TaxID=3241598 RepID=UPI003531C3BF